MIDFLNRKQRIGKQFHSKKEEEEAQRKKQEDEKKRQAEKIKQEEEDGTGGPMQQGEEPQVSAEQYPPEDNTADEGSAESMTPQLDSEVEKYSALLNRR
jgi:hypothetical protein